MDKNIGLSAGIFALLALAARIAVPTGHEAGALGENAGTPKKVKASDTGAPPRSYEGPWLATRRFFAPPLSSLKDSFEGIKNPDKILRYSRRKELWRFFGMGGTNGVESVLATVPDPYHTRLALVTDRTIDAIEKGAVEAGWEFAAEWLPWNDTVDPDEGDPAKRAEQRLYLRGQEVQPGLLVFRRAALDPATGRPSNDWDTDTLLVFVVGETPTTGINPGQFEIARAYMTALSDPKHQDPVRIDGPTFSGSFDSLAVLIGSEIANQPKLRYKLQSGTVQSWDDARAFQAALNPRNGPEVVEFHSATANLWDQARNFNEVLVQQLRIPPDRAAVLTEDESAFGGEAFGVSHLRTLRFPRDISHLRDAYRQAQSQQAANTRNTSSPNLDFSLKDPKVGEDAVPTYSPTQTPLSQNGVVNEIARAIRRDGIRIVELSATNVYDTLFLAGVLRRQCPDTRLLILNADLLFVQAEQTQPLDGTLFLASYPPFAESKPREAREIAVFPDAPSQGVFNATVLLLTGGKPPETALADYAWQSIPYPPDWLLTLDHRGFMPVKVWPNDARQGWFQSVYGTKAKLDPSQLASPPIYAFLSMAFAVFAAAIGVCIAVLLLNKRWIADARFEPPKSERSWRGFYLFLFLLILIGIQVVIRGARPLDTADWRWLILMLPGFGLPALIAGIVLFRQRHAGWLCWLAMGIGMVLVLAAVVTWFLCLRGGSQDQILTRGQLFSFRAAELRFGSSPLWPIVAVAAALLLWCSVHVTRLYVAFCQQPEVITDGLESLLKGRLKKAHDDFTASARSLAGRFTWHQLGAFGITLVVFVALCGAFRVDQKVSSIEGATYDRLCLVLQLLLAGLLLLTSLHILDLWRSLHDLTTNLDILPLARRFCRASPAGGNRPIWVRRLNLQSLDIHINSARVLHDMELLGAQLSRHGLSASMVERWSKLYRDWLGDLLDVDHSRTRKQMARRRRKLSWLGKLVTRQMWQFTLMPAWASEPLVGKMAAKPSTKADDPDSEGEGTLALVSEQPLCIPGDPKNVAHLAETFVALHYSQFLLYAVRQIQNLFWFPSIGFVLLMFSVNSYSFQAPQAIGRLLLVLFAAITLILGMCMAGIERDPILSRIAGTNPGELNAGFYLKLARYGALPIVGLLASLFPSISNLLFSWFEPALEALK